MIDTPTLPPAAPPETSLLAPADPYREFVRRKVAVAHQRGFDIQDREINPLLKDHQRAIVRWAVKGGRRAIFASFGLGKTVTALEIVRLVIKHAGGRGLIILPLGVRQEFTRDARLLATGDRESITDAQRAELATWLQQPGNAAPDAVFIRRSEEVQRDDCLYLTNYESVRDGKINPALFTCVSLDEAAALRGMGGTKTFRTFMTTLAGDDRSVIGPAAGGIPYRFVATATPAPNDYEELLAYSCYLGIQDVSASKTRFFKRDSTQADSLTIREGKWREFWLWVASWAILVQKPSDLGPEFSDEGYELPELIVNYHEVPASEVQLQDQERDGQLRLMRDAAVGLREAAREKRGSLGSRIEKLVEIINGCRGEKGLSEGLLRKEQARATGTTTSSEQAVLRSEQIEGQRQEQILAREQPGQDGGIRSPRQREEPREAQNTQCGVVCGKQTESDLSEPHAKAESKGLDRSRLQEAIETPGQLLRDMPVNGADGEPQELLRGPLPPNGVSARAVVPEVQFRAGDVQRQSRTDTEGGGIPSEDQWVIWCDLNTEQQAAERALRASGLKVSSLYGAQGIDARELLLNQWRDGETDVFLTKPSMYGAGANLQQSHLMAFVGIGYKFAEFIQGIHREYRFGQENVVHVHVIYSEAERSILKVLLEKWEQHKILTAELTAIVQEFGLGHANIGDEMTRAMGVERRERTGKGWTLINADCVEAARQMPENSAGLLLTSIPFSNQYEYSPNFMDFGHSDSNAHFWQQMEFLIPEIYRVLQPGRIAAIHVKDRITPGGINGLGFQTAYPLHCDTVTHFTTCPDCRKRQVLEENAPPCTHRFGYLGMRTIVTDVVRENNQTYRLGWTEQCKDGSKMGCGMPEYLLLFRKPPSDRADSYADVPILKAKAEYTRSRWQVDAHAYWRSNGDRPLTAEDLGGLGYPDMYRLFRKHSYTTVYSYEEHVKLAEALETCTVCQHIHVGTKRCGQGTCDCTRNSGRLPVTFMLFQPQVPEWCQDVWADITRMRTLNASQYAKGKEMHLCPMQLDIADRVINQMSNPGDLVWDPFMGLGTVAQRSILLGRRAIGTELNTSYWLDSVSYLERAEQDLRTPRLFDLLDEDDEDEPETDVPEGIDAPVVVDEPDLPTELPLAEPKPVTESVAPVYTQEEARRDILASIQYGVEQYAEEDYIPDPIDVSEITAWDDPFADEEPSTATPAELPEEEWIADTAKAEEMEL